MFNKKAIVAMTILGGMVVQATPIFAAAQTSPTNTIKSGTTPVTYDNRQVLPDGNGQYGMIIPTAISFTDKNTTANADVEITGINGYKLEDWKELSVQASVQSKNEYKLKLNGNGTESATYELKYGGETAFTGASANQIKQKLGIGGHDNASKATGTATLKDKAGATKKGQYTDTLTYSFKELQNTKN
ncbi:hypothetical protein SAMN05421767_14611 [Granulicatella balaenopterae]|uniref:WxL domain surface cell wall-binding n=1 Tax=Granulicatella balaenopterae TaxID=137733 RepID=A0A1H9NUR8_9LACT|nr:hypothetical protein [Granulicatella balaenopterae]SER39672.1 hypothetical protein SAMN05421767_14611 [Granulicatella balaenopterae]